LVLWTAHTCTRGYWCCGRHIHAHVAIGAVDGTHMHTWLLVLWSARTGTRGYWCCGRHIHAHVAVGAVDGTYMHTWLSILWTAYTGTRGYWCCGRHTHAHVAIAAVDGTYRHTWLLVLWTARTCTRGYSTVKRLVRKCMHCVVITWVSSVIGCMCVNLSSISAFNTQHAEVGGPGTAHITSSKLISEVSTTFVR